MQPILTGCLQLVHVDNDQEVDPRFQNNFLSLSTLTGIIQGQLSNRGTLPLLLTVESKFEIRAPYLKQHHLKLLSVVFENQIIFLQHLLD